MICREGWQQYSAIKALINEYWQLQEGKRYEDFIRKLATILAL